MEAPVIQPWLRSSTAEDLCTSSEQSKLQKLGFCAASSVQCLESTYTSSSAFLFFLFSISESSFTCCSFLCVHLSGAAVSLHLVKQGGSGGQGCGSEGVGWGRRRGARVGVGGGGEEGGVRAHLVDVDVGGVEQDVVLPAEAGEDGRDARHQLGERGPALRLRVPALDHHGVAAGEERSKHVFFRFTSVGQVKLIVWNSDSRLWESVLTCSYISETKLIWLWLHHVLCFSFPPCWVSLSSSFCNSQ